MAIHKQVCSLLCPPLAAATQVFPLLENLGHSHVQGWLRREWIGLLGGTFLSLEPPEQVWNQWLQCIRFACLHNGRKLNQSETC